MKYANVFALGDCSSVPKSRTAAAISQEAPVVAQNLLSSISNKPLTSVYTGYSFYIVDCNSIWLTTLLDMRHAHWLPEKAKLFWRNSIIRKLQPKRLASSLIRYSSKKLPKGKEVTLSPLIVKRANGILCIEEIRTSIFVLEGLTQRVSRFALISSLLSSRSIFYSHLFKPLNNSENGTLLKHTTRCCKLHER